MRKLIWILILVFAASLSWWGFAISQEKPEAVAKSTASEKADTAKAKGHAYVGVGKCGCHKMKTWGNIPEKWAATKHATAYTTLANKQSMEIAKEMKIEDPQKSAKCLVCHVTGYEASAELKEKGYSEEEGVTCETCHGPAGDYIKSHAKKDSQKQAAADGLMKPTEELCVTCHNKKSPTFQEIKFAEAIKVVEHHKPTAEELEKAEKAEGK